MYVVIAGGGVMGQALARSLVAKRHDVVVIEREQQVCEHVASRVGALAIHGTATSMDILDDAGMDKADVAVGALPHDADNLAFVLLARHFAVPRTMARVRNPRYEAAYKLAGVGRCIKVSELFVNQLVLEIEQPTLRQVATFGGGKAAIVVATIPERAVVHGNTVQQIAQHPAFPQECVIAGIFRQRDDKFIFPRGAITVSSGDQVFLAAGTEQIQKAAIFLQRRK